MMAPPRRKLAHLPAPAQAVLDELVRTRGTEPTAKHLAISPDLVNRLVYGGAATPAAVERVAARLREVAR